MSDKTLRNTELTSSAFKRKRSFWSLCFTTVPRIFLHPVMVHPCPWRAPPSGSWSSPVWLIRYRRLYLYPATQGECQAASRGIQALKFHEQPPLDISYYLLPCDSFWLVRRILPDLDLASGYHGLENSGTRKSQHHFPMQNSEDTSLCISPNY